MVDTHGAAAGEQRGAAMGQAAAEAGVGTQELFNFAEEMLQQSQGVNEQLRRCLRDTADRHQRGMRAQAAELGRLMMEQRVSDNRHMGFLEKDMANMQ